MGLLLWNIITSSGSQIIGHQIILVSTDHVVVPSGSKLAKCPFWEKWQIAMKQNHYINFNMNFLRKGWFIDLLLCIFGIHPYPGTSVYACSDCCILFLVITAQEECAPLTMYLIGVLRGHHWQKDWQREVQTIAVHAAFSVILSKNHEKASEWKVILNNAFPISSFL